VIAIAVGTRPEIVKMAPIVRACIARGVDHALLHTGQHYSHELDGVFFDELGLPPPHANLAVGSQSAPRQLAAILERIEPVLAELAPDAVLVQGDTNSVLAVALAAEKSGIPVGHVEAGLRSYDRTMPEEINRVLTDHLSQWLFAPTEHAAAILHAEGFAADRVLVTGNTVVDELLRQSASPVAAQVPARFGVAPGRYALATVHRAENTGDPDRLRGILRGLDGVARALDMPVLAALHPRTTARMHALGLTAGDGVRALPPLGYVEFVGLEAHAALVLTDSGGLQEEACVLRVPCVTLRDNTERPESVDVGANVLAGADATRIVACARTMIARPRRWPNPFGDGHAGERIVDALLASGAGLAEAA